MARGAGAGRRTSATSTSWRAATTPSLSRRGGWGGSMTPRRLLERARGGFVDVGDRAGAADVLQVTGTVAAQRGDTTSARERYLESLAIRERARRRVGCRGVDQQPRDRRPAAGRRRGGARVRRPRARHLHEAGRPAADRHLPGQPRLDGRAGGRLRVRATALRGGDPPGGSPPRSAVARIRSRRQPSIREVDLAGADPPAVAQLRVDGERAIGVGARRRAVALLLGDESEVARQRRDTRLVAELFADRDALEIALARR